MAIHSPPVPAQGQRSFLAAEGRNRIFQGKQSCEMGMPRIQIGRNVYVNSSGGCTLQGACGRIDILQPAQHPFPAVHASHQQGGRVQYVYSRNLVGRERITQVCHLLAEVARLICMHIRCICRALGKIVENMLSRWWERSFRVLGRTNFSSTLALPSCAVSRRRSAARQHIESLHASIAPQFENDVYIATSEPHGNIEAFVTRKDVLPHSKL